MKSLASYSEYINQKFKQVTFETEIIEDTLFTDCTFSNCSFRETQFHKCRFNTCLFEKCDLSLIEVPDSSFQSTQFKQSKVIGVNWTLATWSQFTRHAPIQFDDCVLDYATFIGLTLQKISFQGCRLRQVEFSEADLTDANFQNATLTESRFRQTNLTRANFTQAVEYTIDVTQNIVTKTQFSLPEAYALLHSIEDIVLLES